MGRGRLIRIYRRESLWTRFHLWLRACSCPFDAIERLIPPEGKIVDLGCGFGYFAHLLVDRHPPRKVVGLDADQTKIQIATRSAKGVENPRFRTADLNRDDLEQCDVLTALDLFYLLPYDTQERLISRAYQLLPPKGAMVLKTMSHRPRWKAGWNRFQEFLAVRVLGITEGHYFYFRTVPDWRRLLEHVGFTVTEHSLDRGYLHPHLVLIARK